MFIEEQQKLRVEQRGQVGIAWTGQAGFAFKDVRGFVYHVDPYFSDACSRFIGYHRAVPPPVEAKDVKADYFLFTHEHRDHLDPDSVPIMAEANPNAVFVGPPSCLARLREMGISSERITALRRGESIPIGNAWVHAVPAFHTDDSVGYVLQFDDVTVYITGDTVYSDELLSIGTYKPDVMMSCINGKLGCMNIADAARLASRIQPKYAVPMHIQMFTENTADPEEYVRQVEAYGGATKGFMMKMGQWYVFDLTRGFI